MSTPAPPRIAVGLPATEVNPPVVVRVAEVDHSIEVTLHIGHTGLALDAANVADRASLRLIIEALRQGLEAGTERLEAPSRVHPPAVDADDVEEAMPKLAALMARPPYWTEQ